MANHNHLIASKLTQQVSCLESIAALLDDELNAIASKRGEGLKSIAQQKISLLQQIQTIDKEVQNYQSIMILKMTTLLLLLSK